MYPDLHFTMDETPTEQRDLWENCMSALPNGQQEGKINITEETEIMYGTEL